MSDSFFTDAGLSVPDRPVRTIVAFCAFMAARVVAVRGGKTSDHIAECADFMTEVVGRRLSVRDNLPSEFDWRPSAAVECAEAMLEYDA